MQGYTKGLEYIVHVEAMGKFKGLLQETIPIMGNASNRALSRMQASDCRQGNCANFVAKPQESHQDGMHCQAYHNHIKKT